MNEIEKQLAVIRQGVTEIIPETEFREKLKRSLSKNQPLRIKYGIDPTAPELHLGHSVPIRKLRDFQNLGHRVIFLVGDFTALIGDPTGRIETRPILSPEEIKQNLQTYQEQASKLLDLEKTEFVLNSTWLEKLNFKDVIKLTSSFTVAQILERDDFSQRYRNGNPISLQEFLYPLLQGYDSVALKSDVEIGATEQKFNLLAGRTLQEAFGMEKQVVITVPILEGTDGIRKMSKTYGNYIPVTATAGDMFGKIMSIPDNLMERYFRCLTSVPEEGIKEILSGHPKEAKEQLAFEITSFYHGKDSGRLAQSEFNRIFSQKNDPTEVTEWSYHAADKLQQIIHTLALNSLIPSISEGKRLLKNGGIKVNGAKVIDGEFILEPPNSYTIKVGKLLFLKLVYKQKP
ncbi:MAG: tyrosine--tRNA ligase [Candidatus Omnitrophica bacterium]|nr:tyrosine--tRNA ligase [Candidatus Omnitrophota bacterium]